MSLPVLSYVKKADAEFLEKKGFSQGDIFLEGKGYFIERESSDGNAIECALFHKRGVKGMTCGVRCGLTRYWEGEETAETAEEALNACLNHLRDRYCKTFKSINEKLTGVPSANKPRQQ